MKARARSAAGLYRKLLRQTRPCWLHLAAASSVSLLASAVALLRPLPLKIAVDSVIGSHPAPAFLQPFLSLIPSGSRGGLLALTVALAVGIAVLDQAQRIASSQLGAYAGEKLTLAFRAQLFRHCERLSLSYHDTKGTADALYRIQYDAMCLSFLAVDGLLPLVTSVFTLAGMVYVTTRIDWQLSLIAVTVSPVFVLLSRLYRRRFRSRSREVKRLESFAMTIAQEVLSGLRVVKAFGQEDREERRVVRRFDDAARARLRLSRLEGVFGGLLGLVAASGTAAVLFVGVRRVEAGVLSLGELLLVMGYLAQLYEPLTTIGRKAASLQPHLASAERAFSLLEEHPEVSERPRSRGLSRAEGHVAFRNVSFGYDEGRPILRDVSFEIRPGTRMAVIGTTGAGKTTLINLLTRFYDPQDGQLLLDGTDLRDYRLADLRQQFAIVSQDPVLFSTSIGENIAYARPDASDEEIITAARSANAHEFISALPRGYNTQVGERGMKLSGGERQRISLARAFLKDAPILILDEPTSAVDVGTEEAILEALGRLVKGRTCLIVTHRLSLLEGCDAVLRVEQGRGVVETPLPAAGVEEGRYSSAGSFIANGALRHA